MEVKKDKVLFSYKDDIAKRKLVDWFTSHISFLLPIHRCKGEICLEEDQLTIMHGLEENKIPDIILTKNSLINVYHGFDNVFRAEDDRSRGITFKPLRLTYTQDGKENSLYLITSFNRLTRTTNNQDWYETLNHWKNSNNS